LAFDSTGDEYNSSLANFPVMSMVGCSGIPNDGRAGALPSLILLLHHDLAPPEMTSALRGMRPQEKDALADYISRLGNSEALLDLNR
jgi:hypothetical protein